MRSFERLFGAALAQGAASGTSPSDTPFVSTVPPHHQPSPCVCCCRRRCHFGCVAKPGHAKESLPLLKTYNIVQALITAAVGGGYVARAAHAAGWQLWGAGDPLFFPPHTCTRTPTLPSAPCPVALPVPPIQHVLYTWQYYNDMIPQSDLVPNVLRDYVQEQGIQLPLPIGAQDRLCSDYRWWEGLPRGRAHNSQGVLHLSAWLLLGVPLKPFWFPSKLCRQHAPCPRPPPAHRRRYGIQPGAHV